MGTTPNAIFVFNIHSPLKNHTISLKEEALSVAISQDASQFAVGMESGKVQMYQYDGERDKWCAMHACGP